MFEFFREAKKSFQERFDPILFPNEVAQMQKSEESIKQHEESIKQHEESIKRNEEKVKEIEARIATKNAEAVREEQERASRRISKHWW